LRLEGSRGVAEHQHWIIHFVIRIHDEDRVDAGRQARIARGAEHGSYVLQSLALHTAANRFDHLRLDVFGVDEPVRADAVREMDREPAIAGADIGDHRAFSDLQRVHDLIRLLPQLSIRRVEQAEILRLEQMTFRLLRFGREGRGGRGRKDGRRWIGRMRNAYSDQADA
jgi:hypothetical protein